MPHYCIHQYLFFRACTSPIQRDSISRFTELLCLGNVINDKLPEFLQRVESPSERGRGSRRRVHASILSIFKSYVHTCRGGTFSNSTQPSFRESDYTIYACCDRMKARRRFIAPAVREKYLRDSLSTFFLPHSHAPTSRRAR